MVRRAQEKIKARPKTYDDWVAKLNDCKKIWDDYQQPFAGSDQSPLRPERLMKGLAERHSGKRDIRDRRRRASQLGRAIVESAARAASSAIVGFCVDGFRHLRHPRRETRATGKPGHRGRRRRLVPDDAAHTRSPRSNTTYPRCGWCGTTTATARYATCSSACSARNLRRASRSTKPNNFISTDFVMLARSMGVDGRARRARRTISRACSKPRSRPTGRTSSKCRWTAKSARSAPAPGSCRRYRTASRTSGNSRGSKENRS